MVSSLGRHSVGFPDPEPFILVRRPADVRPARRGTRLQWHYPPYSFMICSMEMAPSDFAAEEARLADMDLAWTRWALGSLAELVEIHLRTARMTATEQLATPIVPNRPDFALAQVRLARSVRLSIAMSQRVRENYQDRKAGKAERTPAEETAAEAAPAEAAPAAGPRDSEPRTEPRESLAESECLEDAPEPGEEAEERRDLDAALLPRDRDGATALERVDRLPDHPADAAPVAARPEPDWPRPLDEPDTGRPVPALPKPDSS
ncbi:hypothetical protein ACFW16_22860 [Inquilinus sp. NPDC058860]|uniref:hypothetical protein n=1 Tax=Inquilinus sp. NPDC058860 TaxID=3346652 RepID=UPI00369E9A22